jgi:AAA domain
MNADPTEIWRALTLLCHFGEVYELRALPSPQGIASGYFTDLEKLAQSAAQCSDQLLAGGVYIALNPVKRDLLARASNRVKTFAKNTSGDTDVTERCWLPIDLDPNRPSGISATDAEHELALERAMKVRGLLTDKGWPKPIFADSGNGAHLLYPIDLPNDDASRELLHRVLESLDSLLSDEMVAVDKTTFNAARIWKLYGTVARKGDSMPDRPHRLARILDAPEVPQIVSLEQLREIARIIPRPEPPPRSDSTTQSSLSLESWIAEHGIEVARESPWSGGRRFILKTCLFNPEHKGTSAALLQLSSGAIVYRCLHNGCVSRTWHDVRERFRDTGAPGAAANGKAAGSVWAEAISAPAYIAQGKDAPEMLVRRLAVPGALSVISGTRGLGKTNVGLVLAVASATGGEFLGDALKPCRVLYLNRDNPTVTIRKRLRAWGAERADTLFILGRDKAPPFSAKEAWAQFPLNSFDLVNCRFTFGLLGVRR